MIRGGRGGGEMGELIGTDGGCMVETVNRGGEGWFACLRMANGDGEMRRVVR